MKKRSQTAANTNKMSKSLKLHSSGVSKKRNIKSSHDKNSKGKKKDVEDYLIINGTVYSADTKTQRQEVSDFVSRVRSEARLYEFKKKRKAVQEHPEMRKSSPEQSTQIMSMEEYVNGLTKQQKLRLLEQLQKQMLANPEAFTEAEEVQQIIDTKPQEENECENNDEKMKILNEKLDTVRGQLQWKRAQKMKQIELKYSQKGISIDEKEQKIRTVNKIMERNLKIIDCTRNLFQTILNSRYEHEFLKNKDLDAAIRQLDTFSEIESSPNKEIPLDHQRVQSQSSIQSEAEFQNLSLNLQKNKERQKIEQKKPVEEPLLISPDKPETDLQLQKFQCGEESLTKKLKIPLLMTKQKIEELEQDKKEKSRQKMKIEIDKKISFQMSELESQEFGDHFTTLADINGYIVGLYEYIIKTDLERIVERLNFPYGKSVRDKLYLLQQHGEVDETEYYPVLEQSYYTQYNQQVALSIRKIPEEQKSHHRAVFDCFNSYLNAYRPYYELEGEVYPWSISEKGITFYEINEENIEQVFQKTKIKVLEFASALCGLIPHGIDEAEAPDLIKQKNQQLFQKEERIAIGEDYAKWDIKVINFDVMVRFLITEQILKQEILAAVQEFPN